MAAKPGEKYRIGGNGWWKIPPKVSIRVTDLIVVTDVDEEYVYIDVLRRDHKIGSQKILHTFFKEDFIQEIEK